MHTNLSLSETLCRPHPRPGSGAAAPGAVARPGVWRRLRDAWRVHQAAMAAAAAHEPPAPGAERRPVDALERPPWVPFSPRF